MKEKNLDIRIVNSSEEFKLFWDMHSEYMNRDIFPNDEIGLKVTEEERKWFFSSEYREHMHKLFSRDVDKAYPIFFLREMEVIGFCIYCTYHSEDGKCFIIDYCILPEFRDDNLGTSFFKIVKEIEVSKGAKYFELNVSNKRNMNFWVKQGFVFNGIDDYGVVNLTTKKDGVFLIDVDENNWTKFTTIELSEKHKKYVTSPIEILARAYVYRNYNARVFGIQKENNMIGMLMVCSIAEESEYYELQHILVDVRYQDKAYEYNALKLMLDYLYIEKRYDNVQICVKREDVKAINLYKKVGFKDTDNIDPNVEDEYNLIFSLKDRDMKIQANRESAIN